MEEKEPLRDKHTGIDGDLARRVQEELGQNVYLCYQCLKCTSGCPVGEFFDWQPHQVMRAVQLGAEDVALKSQTPWLCASCQTCTTRCPQGLDITAIMDFLTQEAQRHGVKTQAPEVAIFNQAFLRQVRLWGRAYELGLMAEAKLRTGKFTDDLDLGVRMMRKRKLSLLPSLAHRPKKPKPVAHVASAIAYYPGCSLHSTAAEFNVSAKGVFKALDIPLVEPRGWVCCGGTAAHRSDPECALRLPMENLALVEQSGFTEVTMPCAACFNRHKAAQHEIRRSPAHRTAVTKALGYEYQDTVTVSSLAEALLRRAQSGKIVANVRRPLKGLRVVSYYGCLLTRPPEVTEAPNPENPTDMDRLLAALGAEVRDWSYKTYCCGGANSLTRPGIAVKLSRELIAQARRAGAEAIAVACPLCHANLDARQFQMGLAESTPVLYFTQLMAVAMALPDKSAALHKNLVDPRPLLRSKGLG